MDRRKSIKALLIGTASTGVLLDACKINDKKEIKPGDGTAEKGTPNAPAQADRMEEEKVRDKKLREETFFTPGEMATITVLGDIIIPKDEISGSASDAKVADFIEFIVKDQPELQTPLRGGLRWMEMQSLNRFEKSFTDITDQQRIQIVDDIAYPGKAKPEMKQGVSFFNLIRGLTATGFFTSEIGVKDIGYMGNVPNQWNGVPADVLKQYNMAYSERELKECVSFDKA
ncbi:MAG: gluconate 2-dehydrogenase subunit 3 family protein [Bacteroidota bacterium]|nr:gluconate 2-dehydrogenase subunit 3 family protein [Bacteroidota bacterium]